MTVTYEVKVDGTPIPFGDHQWILEAGVVPPIQTWEAPTDFVDNLVTNKAGQEITLELGGLKIERVILLGNAPSGNPLTQLLVFVDVRWYWTRAWFLMDVNLRRRIGDTRLLGSTLTAASPVVQDIQYAGFSLNGSDPWTWRTLNDKVMAVSNAQKNGRPEIKYVIDDPQSTSFRIEPKILQESVSDSQMPIGIARAVSTYPGRSLYVDLAGVVHIFDASLAAEKALVESLPPVLLAHGTLKWVSEKARRPSNYRIKFTPEYEVRFTIAGFGPWSTVNDTDPYLENVLQVPDLTLQVPQVGNRAARTVGQGSYITHAEAYAAWGKPSTGEAQLTDDIVRAGYLGGWLYATYVTQFLATPDLVWQRRIGAVVSSYRKLFRVNPKFWTRVLSAREVMTAIWDTETGTRAPSPVYCNFARKPTVRWLAAGLTALGSSGTEDSTNLSYATTGNLADGAPSGMSIRIVDDEQGILEVTFNADPFGRTVDVAPSAIDSIPNLDPSTEPLARSLTWSTRSLVPAANYAMATVLSCVPAAPNDVGRLYEVVVPISEAVEALGVSGSDVTASGPDQELRTTLDTARFAWGDDQNTKDRIVQGFVGADPNASVSATDPSLTFGGLVPVNLELELRPLARAVAAVDLATRIDHYQGTLATPIDARIAPVGSVSTVVHRVTKDMATTTLVAPAPRPVINPIDLLPAAARKIIAREVQP